MINCRHFPKKKRFLKNIFKKVIEFEFFAETVRERIAAVRQKLFPHPQGSPSSQGHGKCLFVCFCYLGEVLDDQRRDQRVESALGRVVWEASLLGTTAGRADVFLVTPWDHTILYDVLLLLLL